MGIYLIIIFFGCTMKMSKDRLWGTRLQLLTIHLLILHFCYPANAQLSDSVISRQADRIHFHKHMDQLFDSVVAAQTDTFCILEKPLTKARPESSLGNWLADAILRCSPLPAQACILSFSVCDTAYIPPGPFRRKDLYQLISRDDEMILLDLSGSLVQDLCDSIAKMGGTPLAGISFSIHDQKAKNCRINDKELHPQLLYRILMNRRLLYDQRLPAAIIRGKRFINCFRSVRELLGAELEYYRQTRTSISSKPDKRIHYDY
jgi:hypothetical protein